VAPKTLQEFKSISSSAPLCVHVLRDRLFVLYANLVGIRRSGRGELMQFAEAVQALSRGHQVRRNGWKTKAVLLTATGTDQIVSSSLDESFRSFWCPRVSDFLATDWEIHVPGPRGTGMLREHEGKKL
jgi:hypothetical protein